MRGKKTMIKNFTSYLQKWDSWVRSENFTELYYNNYSPSHPLMKFLKKVGIVDQDFLKYYNKFLKDLLQYLANVENFKNYTPPFQMAPQFRKKFDQLFEEEFKKQKKEFKKHGILLFEMMKSMKDELELL